MNFKGKCLLMEFVGYQSIELSCVTCVRVAQADFSRCSCVTGRQERSPVPCTAVELLYDTISSAQT